MNFLQETVWILSTYGAFYSACGLAISFAMVVWGSLRARRVPRMVTLAAAILVLWIAMIVGVESGYYAWQSTPHPPDEAFSDTGGPFFVLFLGWLPSLVVTRDRASRTPLVLAEQATLIGPTFRLCLSKRGEWWKLCSSRERLVLSDLGSIVTDV